MIINTFFKKKMMNKFSSILCVLLLMLTSFTAGMEYLRGDVDQNSVVNIADVTELIDYLLSGDASQINLANADTDQSGSVNIADVTELIDYLLNGQWSWNEPQDEHEWVDLGLTSGTLWATCNVGATAPEDYGDYFAWGETEPKEDYSWSTYKWCNGSYKTQTKYCTNSKYGTVDDKTELEPEDDAAFVNWGSTWRMPTYDQQMELVTECSWQWTVVNGVNGRLATGPNGNTLFLPAAGCRYNSSLEDAGLYGYVWSRTLHESASHCARYLTFNRLDVDGHYYTRYQGFVVRPVRVPQN